MRNNSIVVDDSINIISIYINFATLMQILLWGDFFALLCGSRRKLIWFLHMLLKEKCKSSALAS